MDPVLPAVPILYNYDTDRDAFPGLLIAKGGSGPDESDPTKYQAWQTPVFAGAVVIEGDAMVKLWSATKDFDPALGGAVTVYLRDFDGWSYVELGSGTLDDAPWQHGAPSWGLKTLTFPIGSYTVAAGHSLELKVIVEGWSAADMWFAYDTGPYRSRVSLSLSSDTLTSSFPETAAGSLFPWCYR